MRVKLKTDMHVVRWVATAILLISVVSSIAPRTISLFTRGYLPNIDAGRTLPHDYEYEAALWIKENTPPNTVIISDPVSMEILSGLADRIPLALISMGVPSRPEDRMRLDIILRLLKADKDSDIYVLLGELRRMGITTEEFYRSFRPMEGISFVLLISSRASLWIDTDGQYPVVYFNETPVQDRHVLTFLESDTFKLVYKVSDLVYVFMPLYEAVLAPGDFAGDTGETLDDHTLYLPFDETSGDIARDRSWDDNDGAIFGAAWTDGRVGSGLSFDGRQAYVEVPDAQRISPTDAITVEAWIKPVVTEKEQRIVYKRNQYLLRIDSPPPIGNSAIDFFVMIDGVWEPRATSKIVPESGNWYHVVGTYDGENVSIYVNGELRAQTPRKGSMNSTGNPVWIGGIGNFFQGVIDEVRIYSRALSASEISSHYKGEFRARARWASPLYHTSGYIVSILYTFSSPKVEIYVKAAVSETSPDRLAFTLELYNETAERLIYSRAVRSAEFGRPKLIKNVSTRLITLINLDRRYMLKIYFPAEVTVFIEAICIKSLNVLGS